MIDWISIKDDKPNEGDYVLTYYIKNKKEMFKEEVYKIGYWEEENYQSGKYFITDCFWIKLNKPDVEKRVEKIINRFEILDL